jgi:hypothetical protein
MVRKWVKTKQKHTCYEGGYSGGEPFPDFQARPVTGNELWQWTVCPGYISMFRLFSYRTI